MMSLRARGRQLLIHATTALHIDAANRIRERGAMQSRGQSFVRVLYFHGTRPARAPHFRRQLAWLQRHFDIIDFAGFKQRFESAERPRTDRPAVLLTFDDGFVSNHDVAAPLLEEFGMRGVFFVAPAFTLADEEASRAFFATQLHGRAEQYERAMTPGEIATLAKRGHTIGNHTFSHARLSAIPEATYRHEILDAADLIESWTGRPVEAFAWPYRWNAITAAAHRLAAERHVYCFSPCAGVVDPQADSPALLWRTNAEADRPFAEFRFQCSGFADYANAARRQRVRALLGVPPAGTGSVPPHHAALALRNSRARS